MLNRINTSSVKSNFSNTKSNASVSFGMKLSESVETFVSKSSDSFTPELKAAFQKLVSKEDPYELQDIGIVQEAFVGNKLSQVRAEFSLLNCPHRTIAKSSEKIQSPTSMDNQAWVERGIFPIRFQPLLAKIIDGLTDVKLSSEQEAFLREPK